MTKRIQLKGSLIPNDYQEIYDFIKKDGTSASRLIEQLPEDNSDVVIEVNSFGGRVTVGSEMYTALRNYKGKVTAEVTGMAASAASFAIMGADKIVMSPTAQMMIHKALLNFVSGNSDDLDRASEALKASDKAIVNAYMSKTGLSEDELMNLMAKETYMSAQDAVDKGFADEIMSFEDYKAVASLGDDLLTDEEVARIRAEMQEIDNMKLEIEKEEILQGL
ncbi:head maturation protease, ClpP-related [Streptococcus uberis]|uniref:head maturation protease, ClpP-related n=1 Tax=Streptococcus uberis TaxID=1349 RepID=UPI002ECD9206|nr:head maturation protease, ClpP-related [Streptococcus uberis]